MITNDKNLIGLAKDVLDGNFSLPLVEVVLRSCGRDINNFEVSCRKVHSHWPEDSVCEFIIDTPLKYEAFCNTSCIICRGDYEIPASDTIRSLTNGDGFYYTDLHDCFEVKLNEDLKVRAHSGNGCMDIVISHSSELKEETLLNIIHTLSFVFGVPLQNVMYSIKDQGYWIMTETADNGFHTAYCPPISNSKLYGPDYCANHKELAAKYFAFLEKDDKNLLPILVERVQTARQTYIYIFAVTLATQIESLVKFYFARYYKPDTTWNPALDKCIEMVEAASADALGKKEKDHLKDILSREKVKEKVTAKDVVVRKALDAMCREGLINDKELCKVWSRLRNKTAHGETVTDQDFIAESLALLKDYYLCLNLYHQLLFALIGYKGKYTYREYNNDRRAEY